MTNQTQQDKFIYLPIYLNDWVSDGRKLTMVQRGALIDLSVLYFQENLKLKYSKEQIYRLVFAFEKQEQEAVDFILENYFIKSENEPMGFNWVSIKLNELGDRILKRLNASRENGKKGGRKNKKIEEPTGLNSLNLDNNLDESILNQIKLNQIKLKENETKLKTNKKQINPIYKELSDGLLFVLEAKLQKKLSSKNWEDEIRKIIEIDLKPRQNPVEDVTQVIQAIANNYGKDYFPIVQSASSLREKFTKIENYISRGSKGNDFSSIHQYNSILNDLNGGFNE